MNVISSDEVERNFQNPTRGHSLSPSPKQQTTSITSVKSQRRSTSISPSRYSPTAHRGGSGSRSPRISSRRNHSESPTGPRKRSASRSPHSLRTRSPVSRRKSNCSRERSISPSRTSRCYVKTPDRSSLRSESPHRRRRHSRSSERSATKSRDKYRSDRSPGREDENRNASNSDLVRGVGHVQSDSGQVSYTLQAPFVEVPEYNAGVLPTTAYPAPEYAGNVGMVVPNQAVIPMMVPSVGMYPYMAEQPVAYWTPEMETTQERRYVVYIGDLPTDVTDVSSHLLRSTIF